MKKNNIFIIIVFTVVLFCAVRVPAQTAHQLFALQNEKATDSSSAWVILTDRLMEGCSKAEMENTDTSLLFSGTISSSNKAGLAQLISPRFSDSLHLYTGLTIRLRGDSSTFILALHPDLLSSDAKHLEYSMVASTNWQTLEIPFSAFSAAYFDVQLLERAPALSTIHYFSIINAYQEGRFGLEIDFLGLY
jgi:hypothetical protein